MGSLVRGSLRWIGRAALSFIVLLVVYFGIVLVGLIPVNNDFLADEQGVEIMVISNAVHADLVLPLHNEHCDWRNDFSPSEFIADTNGATHVAIGWGDAGFFIHTPTWNDLKFSTAANALLWPSQSCLHVSMTRDEYVRPHAQVVKVSPQQYGELVQFIQSTFVTNDAGEKVSLEGAYGRTDAFYEAAGNYHALNTCNSWAGRGLKSAGVRVPWLTPMPKSVFLYLPEDDGSH